MELEANRKSQVAKFIAYRHLHRLRCHILCDNPLVHSLAHDVAALYRHVEEHLVPSEVPHHLRVLLLLALVRPLVEHDDVPLPRGRGPGHAAVDHRLVKSLVQFEPAYGINDGDLKEQKIIFVKIKELNKSVLQIEISKSSKGQLPRMKMTTYLQSTVKY